MTTVAPPLILTDNIPEALKVGKRFVGWRSEDDPGQKKPRKMPYSPNAVKGASSTAPADWVTFDQAVKYATVAGLDGVMRAFGASDGMVGLDLDNCRDPETGELTPEAAERVKRADTYTEVSPSGTGVKLWMYGTLPPHGRKKGDVEMYASARFFTMTGQHVEGTPAAVCYRPDFVLALHREVFGEAPDPTVAPDDPDRPVPALQLGDEDVLRLASKSQHNGERFRLLWSGDTSGYAVDGNDGESEAEAALCEILAYYGGPDRERIERLWLRSGLGARDKVQRADYRKRTIDLALRGKTRFYGDSMPTPASSGSNGADTCPCEACPSRDRVRFLERCLLDRDDFVESIQACNGTLSRKLTEANARIERLNRQIYADNRLSRVKTLTSSQKDTIRALARVAPSRADHFDNDAPIITSETIGKEIGKHESTGRLAAEAVCNLPGAPIKRGEAPGGKYGKVTTYELAVRDPAEILERFVVIAENLEEKVSSRPQPPRCSQHPNAPVRVYSRTVCGACRKTLASTFPGEDALCVQNPRIAPDQEPVDEHVVTSVQNARIAAEPPVAMVPLDDGLFGDDEVDSPHTVSVDVGPPLAPIPLASRTVHHFASVEVSEEAKRRDLDILAHCPQCRGYGPHRRRSGIWRCALCSEVLSVESWAEVPPDRAEPPPEPSALPLAPSSHIAGAFRRSRLPARVAGGETDE